MSEITGKECQPANIMWFTGDMVLQLMNGILDLSEVEILNYHFFFHSCSFVVQWCLKYSFGCFDE